MSNAIFCPDSENILIGGVTSGTSPTTSYSRDDVISRMPARRTLYGATTVTLTITISSKTGSIVVLPVSNCDPSVVALTNAAGLNVPFPQPARPEHNIPLTAALDFSASSNRTSTAWNLVITSNSANVLLGGGFAIYSTKHQLVRNYEYGWEETETDIVVSHRNGYGVEFRDPQQTVERVFQYSVKVRATDLAALRSFYRANRGQPGTFWPDPSVNEAFYGVWEQFHASNIYLNYARVTMTFRELVKGKPVA